MRGWKLCMRPGHLASADERVNCMLAGRAAWHLCNDLYGDHIKRRKFGAKWCNKDRVWLWVLWSLTYDSVCACVFVRRDKRDTPRIMGEFCVAADYRRNYSRNTLTFPSTTWDTAYKSLTVIYKWYAAIRGANSGRFFFYFYFQQ